MYYQHYESHSHRDVQQCVGPSWWGVVTISGVGVTSEVTSQDSGVTQTEKAHQPQEEDRLNVVGSNLPIRVDVRLQHKYSSGQDQRHHLIQ